jgi:hypothetical protein
MYANALVEVVVFAAVMAATVDAETIARNGGLQTKKQGRQRLIG